MATARQLRALIDSFGSGSHDKFLSTAQTIAAQEAYAGHQNSADELRNSIERAKKRIKGADFEASTSVVSLHEPRGDLRSLVDLVYPKVFLKNLVLSSKVRESLDRVISEQKRQMELRRHGLSPRDSLLLVGPPGCGKTMTASALAGELGIGLFSVRLDAVISRYLGESAKKLRVVFDGLLKSRGVYLFDEFDAIGSRRDLKNDVGEARRILNSFLQFMDENRTESIVVAATNYPELLDKALFRRFDDVLEYSLPSIPAIEAAMEMRARAFKPTQFSWKPLAESAEGFSFADVSRSVEEAAKELVLSSRKRLTRELMMIGIQRVRDRSGSAVD